MCGVVAAVTVVTALASAAVQVQQDQTQRKAAKAQNKAADIQFVVVKKQLQKIFHHRGTENTEKSFYFVMLAHTAMDDR